MSTADSELAQLIDVVADGTASPAQLEQLRQLVRVDAQARALYIAQIRMHALLQWRSGQVGGSPVRPVPTPRHTVTRLALRAILALAAALLVGVALWQTTPGETMLATLDEATGVQWVDGSTPTLGSQFGMETLRISAGKLRLKFASGATVALSGPAHIQILSPLCIALRYGQVTVDVTPMAKGFTIETPTAKVVDFGTSFGADVSKTGETQVVVFEGEVDVTAAGVAAAGRHIPLRLVKGQAVQVDRAGRTSRIVVVERQSSGSGWRALPASGSSGVIASVRDNRGANDDPHCYHIVPHGLVEDGPAYVDRNYEWNGVDAAGIPVALRGADLVMTFNNDKSSRAIEITVTLAQPATLYVLVDDRDPPPDWLTQDFVKTDWKIGLDEDRRSKSTNKLGRGPGVHVDFTFTVWKKEIPLAGDITLGGTHGDGNMTKCMYGIAATPLAQ